MGIPSVARGIPHPVEHDRAGLDFGLPPLQCTVIGHHKRLAGFQFNLPWSFECRLDGQGMTIAGVAQVVGAERPAALRVQRYRPHLPTGVQSGNRGAAGIDGAVLALGREGAEQHHRREQQRKTGPSKDGEGQIET